MSLLHQVLQDIDQRDAAKPVLPHRLQMNQDDAAPAAAMACSGSEKSGFIVPADVSRRTFYTVFLLLMVLPALLYFSLNNPSESVAEHTQTVSAGHDGSVLEHQESVTAQAGIPWVSDMVVSHPSGIAADGVPSVSVDSVSVDSVPIHSAAVPDRIAAESEEIRLLRAGPETQENKSALATPATSADTPSAAGDSVADRRLSVVPSGHKAQQYYLQASTYMAEKNFSQALSAVDQALALDVRDDYLAIKLRIFWELKEDQQFLQLYNQNTAIVHPYWLAVAAPGLHMLGQFDDAVRVYQQLILLQPEIVNWPLALAQALQSAGREQQALRVLESLYQQKRLTPDQQRWVEQTLKNIR
ncbi:MAG: tetratricopeptide repeat protein [Saccharospirillaceae bacterium]|nr:tetratricopeptide repeat protein [Saccharospirillaceae bacterium]MCD8530577.1 tetratricopeptide repeat protein [Saccharospirillaceae bacterium]